MNFEVKSASTHRHRKEVAKVRTGLLVGARAPALAAERGAPLAAEAGVLLDHRPAAPVTPEPWVEVEDRRRRVPVPRAPKLHRELRQAVAGHLTRRGHHGDVGPQSQPAGQGEGIARGPELPAGQRDGGRAPRRVGASSVRRGGAGGDGEGVAEEAPAGAERADGRSVERRGGVQRAEVEAGYLEPVARGGDLRMRGVGDRGGYGDGGGADEAVGVVEGEGGEGEERGQGEEQQQRPEPAGGAARPAHGWPAGCGVAFVGLVWILRGYGPLRRRERCKSFAVFGRFKRKCWPLAPFPL